MADCRAPAELEHGFITFASRSNLTTYRSAIRYSCQRPYYRLAPNVTGEGTGRGGLEGLSIQA